MDENPYKATGASDVEWHARLFFIYFYLLAIVCGIVEGKSRESPALDILFSLAMGINLGLWAVTDSRLRGRPIPFNARWWFVVLGVFLVPCYVVWSRGWRGLGWVIANGIAWTVLATAATLATWLLFGGDLPH